MLLIVGTDPTYHHDLGTAGGAKLMAAGLTFAAGGPTTGAFIGLSCYYAFASAGTPVPVLAPFGAFHVVGQSDCFNAVHVLPHPALAGVTDGDLSNWGCSVHEAFTAWPSSFTPAAIALEMPSSFVAPDGSSGAPYILARAGSVQALTSPHRDCAIA